MVSEETSSINLDDILHVTVIPEANIVELVLDGRKTPLTLTLEGAMVSATKVEKAVGFSVGTANASSG